MASAAGISPLIIGLTVVAFGTSLPELAVSIKSTFSGQAGIAAGNVIINVVREYSGRNAG